MQASGSLKATGADAPGGIPAGARNAWGFSFCNAISFQMLGAPLILYAKTLGVTSTMLGLIAAIGPLLTILQIPAAYYVSRFGYRKFILTGWGLRSFFILLLALVPFMALGSAGKLMFIVVALTGFHTLRGIASGAWLPWMSDLIPEQVRGQFLSREQLFMSFGSLVALGGSAILLFGEPRSLQFSALFLVSTVAAWISLLFVRRIPDIELGDKLNESSHPVPWLTMLRFTPFCRILIFNLLFVLAIGSVPVFTVAFLREAAGFRESEVLFFTTFGFLGPLFTLPLLGNAVDRVGSKPMLMAGLLMFAGVTAGWFMFASGLVRLPGVALIGLTFAGGIAGACFSIANLKLLMASTPAMGKAHFYALFTVITSIGLALSPLCWGFCLDAMRQVQRNAGYWEWNHYSIYYAILTLLIVLTACYILRLREKRPVFPSGRYQDFLERGMGSLHPRGQRRLGVELPGSDRSS